MIKRIFWDMDECLIHTYINHKPKPQCLSFVLDGDSITYYTIVRPSALKVIEYSRNLVGLNNVYILTTSTCDYANEISRLSGWNFTSDHILTRETLEQYNVPIAYGARTTLAHKTLAHPKNVLIDNLPPRNNFDKMSLIGITASRYFNVCDYCGVNTADDEWKEDVIKFLNEKHSEPV